MGHPDIVESRRVARWLRSFGAIAFVFGWIIVTAAVVSWGTGLLGFDEAVDVLLIIGLGGVLSGVAMQGSAASLRLSATRLELQIESEKQ
jgi:hypothetical protein